MPGRGALVRCAAAALLAAAFAAGAASAQGAGAGVTVYAAASLTDVFPAIDASNTYSFAGSNALATQITNGAPADVFASANTAIPAQLFAAGLVEKPVVFTRNTLVIVVPKSNPAGIASVYDLAHGGVKIDIAGPAVPVGAYTLQVLDQLGLRAQVTGNVVSQETDVRGVLSKVQLGQADAGFVYATDARTVPGGVTVIRLPAWAQPKVAYSLAIVASSRNKTAAQRFVDEVLSRSGQATMQKYGFLPVTAPTPTIAALSPRRGRPGVSLVVRGTNFATTTSVTFRGIPARFRIVSATSLRITVPAKAKSGPVTVTNPAGSATSAARFIVLR